MSDSRHKRAAEIQQKIRDVLLRHWDPIGVAHAPEAQDEYDGYVGPVYRLLASGASDATVIDFLYKTETEAMGLGFGRLGKRRRLQPVVARLREIDIRL